MAVAPVRVYILNRIDKHSRNSRMKEEKYKYGSRKYENMFLCFDFDWHSLHSAFIRQMYVKRVNGGHKNLRTATQRESLKEETHNRFRVKLPIISR